MSKPGPSPWLLIGLGGAVVIGGALLASSVGSDAPAVVRRVVREGRQIVGRLSIKRVLARVSSHEGSYSSTNRNTDGEGLSYGIIQWTQRSGNLGKVLRAMAKADPAAFRRIFGGAWRELLEVTTAASLAPVAGVVLWAEPWVSRFKEAGRHEPFRAAQRRLATSGSHWQGAVKVAAHLGIHTERAMCLFYDTAVHQGAGAAMSIAKATKKHFTTQGAAQVPAIEVLRFYAQSCAARFRRSTAPSKQPSNPNRSWRQVRPGEWHYFAREFDLYAAVHKRRMGIVNDPDLGDDEVQV